LVRPARSGAAVALALALFGCAGPSTPLTDVQRQELAARCASATEAGQAAFGPEQCGRVVDTVAGDAQTLGCTYEDAERLLSAALAGDRPAVRRIERRC
jgi:hypothetical protein